jgi:FixJ family two-component response regulator
MKLPNLDGFDIQKRIAADELELPIIFISGFADVPMTVRAMKAGAMEFLTKPLSDAALLSAVQNAIDRSRAEWRRSVEIKLLKERYACLSDREREVLRLVVAGRLNKQIGGKLNICEVTVKVHRGRVIQTPKWSFSAAASPSRSTVRSLARLVPVGAASGKTSSWPGPRPPHSLPSR